MQTRGDAEPFAGFGDDWTGASPYVEWPAFDIIAQAMSGVISTTGTESGEMVRVGPSIGDMYPATVAALAITAAVFHARQTGEGQFVDVAMYDALVVACARPPCTATRTPALSARRLGTATRSSRPSTSTRLPTAPAPSPRPTAHHWERSCRLIGREDLLDDERSRTNRDRVAERQVRPRDAHRLDVRPFDS